MTDPFQKFSSAVIEVIHTEMEYLLKVAGGLYADQQAVDQSLGLMAPQASFTVPTEPRMY
jgi:hypothetical protein